MSLVATKMTAVLRKFDKEGHWDRIVAIEKDFRLEDVLDPQEKAWIIYHFFLARYYMKQMDEAAAILQKLEGHFPAFMQTQSDWVLIAKKESTNLKIVASFDAERKPKEGEHVIIYGSYSVSFSSLCFSNPTLRNIRFFPEMKHDSVEILPEWKSINSILVLGFGTGIDVQLAKAGCPIPVVGSNGRVFDRMPNLTLWEPEFDRPLSQILDHLNGFFGWTLVVADDFVFEDLSKVPDLKATKAKMIVLDCVRKGRMEPDLENPGLFKPKEILGRSGCFLIHSDFFTKLQDSIGNLRRRVSDGAGTYIYQAQWFWNYFVANGLRVGPEVGYCLSEI